MGETVQERRKSGLTRSRAAILAAPVLGLALTGCLGSHPNTKASAEPTPSPSVLTSETTTPQTTPSPAESSKVPKQQPEGLLGCKPYFDLSRFHNHEYEVCTAYISNAAQIALQGLYKFGNNRIGYLSASARHHFETRYWDGPRSAAEHEVDNWPKVSNLTGNRVDESIRLESLSSSLQADRAVLSTEESWTVTAKDGQVLYDEALHTKDVTMCRGRLPGHPLHEWVVVSYTRQPDFDCLAFDRTNGLAP